MPAILTTVISALFYIVSELFFYIFFSIKSLNLCLSCFKIIYYYYFGGGFLETFIFCGGQRTVCEIVSSVAVVSRWCLIVALVGLELPVWLSMILNSGPSLFLLPQCWGYRNESPHLAFKSMYLKSASTETWKTCHEN